MIYTVTKLLHAFFFAQMSQFWCHLIAELKTLHPMMKPYDVYSTAYGF